MNIFPLEKAHFTLEGPVGLLEVMTTTPTEGIKKGIGIICHPHPQFDGTMMNKVVHTAAQAYHHLGLKTVRFNFRGVGQSEGAYDHAVGEVQDLLAMMDWVNRVCPNEPLYLAGFSFGAYIAASAASRRPVQNLITIAPVVTGYDFEHLHVTCPWLVIAAENDELIALSAIQSWVQTLKQNTTSPLSLHIVPNASHFFHGKLINLRNLIEENHDLNISLKSW